MSLAQRRHITFQDLLEAANSADPTERATAMGMFQAWVNKGPELEPWQRLSRTQQAVLKQIFDQQRELIRQAQP